MTQTVILNPQNKGQIMIPKKWRNILKADAYKAEFNGLQIVIIPVYADKHKLITKSKKNNKNKKNKKMEEFIKEQIEIWENRVQLQKEFNKLNKEKTEKFTFL